MRLLSATLLVLFSGHLLLASTSVPTLSPVQALVQIQQRYIEEHERHIPALMVARSLEKFAEQSLTTNHAPELVRFFIETLIAASYDLSGGRGIRRTGNYHDENLPERDYLGRAADLTITQSMDPEIRRVLATGDLFNSIIATLMQTVPHLKKHFILSTLIANGDNQTQTARLLNITPEELVHTDIRINLKGLVMETLASCLPKLCFVQRMILQEENAARVAETLVILQKILRAPPYVIGACSTYLFEETLEEPSY